MSHAVVIVLTENGTDDEVANLMAPYDEEGEWFRAESDDRPASKWDWWEIGGRWDDYYGENRLPTSEMLARTREDLPLAVLTPDGVWHEQSELGWWGVRGDDNASHNEWRETYQSLLNTHPDSIAVVVDYHV